MKRMLFGAVALAAAGGPVHSASDSGPLATSQPDPTADVAPYFVSNFRPPLVGRRMVEGGRRGAAREDQIRLRHLQREPFVRP